MSRETKKEMISVSLFDQYKSHIGWLVAIFLFIYHYATIVELKDQSVRAYQKMVFSEIEQMKKIDDPRAYLKTCQPADKVVFLKTHKTGSETLAGILRKYALLNNMTSLLSCSTGGHLYHRGGKKHAPVNDDGTIQMMGYGQGVVVFF